jgi:hypothetical protein
VRPAARGQATRRRRLVRPGERAARLVDPLEAQQRVGPQQRRLDLDRRPDGLQHQVGRGRRRPGLLQERERPRRVPLRQRRRAADERRAGVVARGREGPDGGLGARQVAEARGGAAAEEGRRDPLGGRGLRLRLHGPGRRGGPGRAVGGLLGERHCAEEEPGAAPRRPELRQLPGQGRVGRGPRRRRGDVRALQGRGQRRGARAGHGALEHLEGRAELEPPDRARVLRPAPPEHVAPDADRDGQEHRGRERRHEERQRAAGVPARPARDRADEAAGLRDRRLAAQHPLQVRRQLEGRGVPVERLLGEGPPAHEVHVLRVDLGRRAGLSRGLVEGRRRPLDDLGEELERRLGVEGHAPEERLVEHGPDGPHVGLRPRLAPLAQDLLRRHVVRRAHHGAGGRQPRLAGHALGEAEVGDERPERRAVAGQEHVLRLEVAVDVAVRVGEAHRLRHPEHDLQPLPRAELGPGAGQVGPLDELHGEPRRAGPRPRVEHAHDPRVVERGQRVDLAREAAALRLGRVRAGEDDLHRRGLARLDVSRPKHGAHAPLGDRGLDAPHAERGRVGRRRTRQAGHAGRRPRRLAGDAPRRSRVRALGAEVGRAWRLAGVGGRAALIVRGRPVAHGAAGS